MSTSKLDNSKFHQTFIRFIGLSIIFWIGLFFISNTLSIDQSHQLEKLHKSDEFGQYTLLLEDVEEEQNILVIIMFIYGTSSWIYSLDSQNNHKRHYWSVVACSIVILFLSTLHCHAFIPSNSHIYLDFEYAYVMPNSIVFGLITFQLFRSIFKIFSTHEPKLVYVFDWPNISSNWIFSQLVSVSGISCGIVVTSFC